MEASAGEAAAATAQGAGGTLDAKEVDPIEDRGRGTTVLGNGGGDFRSSGRHDTRRCGPPCPDGGDSVGTFTR